MNTRIVDAERNLPVTVTGSSGATADRFRTSAAEMLASKGLAPDDVAGMVRDAIVADRFWVLTHPSWCGVLEERTAAMRNGELHQRFAG